MNENQYETPEVTLVGNMDEVFLGGTSGEPEDSETLSW